MLPAVLEMATMSVMRSRSTAKIGVEHWTYARASKVSGLVTASSGELVAEMARKRVTSNSSKCAVLVNVTATRSEIRSRRTRRLGVDTELEAAKVVTRGRSTPKDGLEV